jgi:hypothetical protein
MTSSSGTTVEGRRVWPRPLEVFRQPRIGPFRGHASGSGLNAVGRKCPEPGKSVQSWIRDLNETASMIFGVPDFSPNTIRAIQAFPSAHTTPLRDDQCSTHLPRAVLHPGVPLFFPDFGPFRPIPACSGYTHGSPRLPSKAQAIAQRLRVMAHRCPVALQRVTALVYFPCFL